MKVCVSTFIARKYELFHNTVYVQNSVNSFIRITCDNEKFFIYPELGG